MRRTQQEGRWFIRRSTGVRRTRPICEEVQELGGPGPYARRSKPYARRSKLKEHADGYHSGAHEIRVKGTVASQRRRSCVEDTGKQVFRRRSSVEGIDTAQEAQECPTRQ